MTLATLPARAIAVLAPARIDQNPAALYLASLAPGSRRTMHQALRVVTQLAGGDDPLALPWGGLRYQHVAAIRSRLSEAYSPASASKILCALRGALREAWRLGQIPEADFRRAIDIKGVRGETIPKGRALTIGEITGLLQVCAQDPSVAGARDAAIFAVLYAAGLRRAELVGLELDDFDRREKVLHVRRGKGRKDRDVPLAAGAAEALEDWLAVRGDATVKQAGTGGALFLAVNRGGRIHGGWLTTQAVYNALRKRARQAGFRDLSPHDMRRTQISHLLEAGADLVTVSKLAGHASVTTTARYDRRGEAAKRQAVDLLHVPYRRQGTVDIGPGRKAPCKTGGKQVAGTGVAN